MEKRLRSLARIVGVKEHLRRAVEWRLADLDRQEREAIEEERAIIGALNGEHPLHGHLVEAMALHLRKVSERLETVRRARAAEMESLRRETGQLRHAERMLGEAGTDHGRALERKALSELVETTLARASASLP